MAKVFGAELTKSELLDRVGSMDAIAGVRRMAFEDGRSRGMQAYEAVCGRLRFTVLIDKCMDIGELYYDGIPLHFLARPGIMGNQYWYDGPNSSRSIMGGMLFTCGLSNVGPAQQVSGGVQPQHGFIRNAPAVQHGARGYWEGDDYYIELFGESREAALFGENLVLRRTITARLGDDFVRIHDQIENEGCSQVPLMLMYHCNAGYPLLDRNSRLVMDAASTACRDEDARRGMAQESPLVFGTPEKGYAEQVFYHRLQRHDGRCRASLVNPDRRLALTVDFDGKELPYLIQWKCRAAGDYVMGIEPANCHPEGVDKERENGTLRVLSPHESIETDLCFSVRSGSEAMELLQ
ncbi:MAG TPA: aldose 1-epimerase family protein [Feifaniaceae bacterium]|nr:aldose 1-epimerase family protein [Feifaniaceae bacterium]